MSGDAVVEKAGVSQAFADLAWKQVQAGARGETSLDAWELRKLATGAGVGCAKRFFPCPATLRQLPDVSDVSNAPRPAPASRPKSTKACETPAFSTTACHIDVEPERDRGLVNPSARLKKTHCESPEIKVAMADCVVAQRHVVAVGNNASSSPWFTVRGTK